MSTPSEIVAAMVDVSEAFVEIAGTLRTLPDVLSVTQPCLMRRETRHSDGRIEVGKGPGFRVEWYADAMLADGRSLSFSEEVSWYGDGWTIQAAVTVVRGDDEEPLITLPARYATEADDFVEQLGVQTQLLLDSRDSAIRKFGDEGSS